MFCRLNALLLVPFMLITLVAPAGVFAADAKAAEAPQTTSDPLIPVDRLKIMLRPLTKDELKVEVDGWMVLLKAKVQEIANAELGVKKKKEEIKVAEKKADDADEKADKADDKADDAKEKGEKAEKQSDAAKDEAEKDGAAKDGAGKDADGKAVTPNVTQPEVGKDADDAKKKAEDAKKKADEAKKKADADKEKAEAEKKAAEAEKKQAEAEAQAKEDEKVEILEYINELRDQQAKLTDRTRVVLAAYKEKGGETESYEKYMAAVSGGGIDVSDASSFWISIKGWITSEEGGWRWGKNIVFFLLVVLAAWIVSRIVGKAVEKAVNRTKRLSTLLREFVVGIVRKVIFVVGFIVALSMLEVDIGPMMAAIGAIGFVVAFALQETLGNFASGVMILLYRPFDVGDFIDAGGVKGTVRRLTLVSTTMTTPDNQLVIVPNNKIWGNVITNVTGSETRRVDLTFGIGYDDDMGKAIEIMERVVKAHEMTLDDPAPVIKVHELADSSVNFVCRPWVKTSDYWVVYWDLTRQVKEAFDAADITIPYPQQDVYMHQVPEKSA